MSYENTKVYFDGSHYIGIPYKPSTAKRGVKTPEETVVITEQNEVKDGITAVNTDVADGIANIPDDTAVKPRKERRITRKALFEELYGKYRGERKHERKRLILEAMRPFFRSEQEAELYVNTNLERKQRNLICRRVRMSRKANLQDFNYFVTFTYDDQKHTEASFRKKLQNDLSHFCSRKKWKYIGVWERSPKTERLHFHGIFYIPEGTMPGTLLAFNDYNFNTRKRQTVWQNTHFLERFGRCDFERFDDIHRKGEALAYIMKYIEKSGEKIVYSRGLPMYFISDILEDDVLCRTGMEDQKLVLSDDFLCFDEGVLIGSVSPEVIKQLRKSN